MNRVKVTVVVLAALVASLMVVSSATAAGGTLNVTYSGCKPTGTSTGFNLKGCKVSGTLSGTASGTVNVTGSSGVTTLTFSVKGGTIKFRSSGKPKGENISGTWKFIGGTGKYSDVSGSGTFTSKPVGKDRVSTVKGTYKF